MSDQLPARGLGPLGCLGAILLLPGLCSLVFAIGLSGMGQDLSGMVQDPRTRALWLVCFLISGGGLALIALAILRTRRN
jgi:hypothetical protein